MLSNIQELVERSFNKALSKVGIEEGYIVDPLLYNTPELFKARLVSIKENKGFAIEIFSVGSSTARGAKQVPRIVIDTDRFLEGSLGFEPGMEISLSDNSLSTVGILNPLTTTDILIDITLASSKASEDRILHAILNKAIGTKRYIELYSTADKFLASKVGEHDNPEPEEGIIQRVYSYKVEDLIIANDDSTIAIVPINEITLDISTVPQNPANTIDPIDQVVVD